MGVDSTVIPDVNIDATIQVSNGPASPDGTPMDMTQSVQSNGSTVVKRERVDVGFAQADSNPQGALVSSGTPLPVDSRDATTYLAQIASEVTRIRELLELALAE